MNEARVIQEPIWERSVDLGKVVEGQDLRHMFLIRNTTNMPFTVMSVKKSCGCEAANRRFGFDTSFLQRSFANRAAMVPWSPNGEPIADALVSEIALENGRECFEIRADYPKALARTIGNSMSRALGANRDALVPARMRAVIDRKTFEIVEVSLLSQAGQTISKLEFQDVKRMAKLADELFSLPDEIELRMPNDARESF
jgi:hypothetical protein